MIPLGMPGGLVAQEPCLRAPMIPGLHPAESYPAMSRAWETSRATMSAIRQALASPELPPEVLTVGISGSLGRMEQRPHSDVDLLVVLKADQAADERAARASCERVWELLRPLGLRCPNPAGIFARACPAADLTDPARIGRFDETPAVFGTRMQLMLDSQPVCHPEAYDQLLSDVLRFFAAGSRLVSPDVAWSYLLNEATRYYHALRIQTPAAGDRQYPAARLRRVKLGHSRRMIYAGLLFLLGQFAPPHRSELGWLLPFLRLTPLERVATVYLVRHDAGLPRVLASYEAFLSSLDDENLQRWLAGQTVVRDATSQREEGLYLRLLSNSQALAAELTRFILAQRGVWNDQLYQLLLM